MPTEQHPVEVIMARGFMANMATSAFLVDNNGNLIFYNEAAGQLLGISFEELGPMPAAQWGAFFTPTTLDGEPMGVDQLPLVIALGQGRPMHTPMRISSPDGTLHTIEVSAFPIVGRTGQSGAMAIFWDLTP